MKGLDGTRAQCRRMQSWFMVLFQLCRTGWAQGVGWLVAERRDEARRAGMRYRNEGKEVTRWTDPGERC